jgi:hypothetical protein
MPAPRPASARFGCALPAALPDSDSARLLLFAIRRLGAHGLDDAAVAGAYLRAFGGGFRRPLTLTRAFVADCAATATAQIAIAPCCCPRATAAEACMLRAVAEAEQRPEASRLLLGDLLCVRRADGVVASAAALAAAFADAGQPVVA